MAGRSDTNGRTPDGASQGAGAIAQTLRTLVVETLGRLGLVDGRGLVEDARVQSLTGHYARVLEYHCLQSAAAGRGGSAEALITALSQGEFAHGRRERVNLWEDVALAALVAQRDQAATTLLRDRFAERVGQWQRRYSRGEPITVEDFLADLLLPRARSGPRIESYRGRGPLDSWLKQVFISLCHKRRAARLGQPSLNEPSGAGEAERDALQRLPAADDPPDERYARYECREKLAPVITECVNRLDGRQRQVLLMALVDGVPQKRIAQLFGVPEYKITRLKQSAVKRVVDSFTTLARRAARLTAEGVRRCLDLLLERFPLD